MVWEDIKQIQNDDNFLKRKAIKINNKIISAHSDLNTKSDPFPEDFQTKKGLE